MKVWVHAVPTEDELLPSGMSWERRVMINKTRRGSIGKPKAPCEDRHTAALSPGGGPSNAPSVWGGCPESHPLAAPVCVSLSGWDPPAWLLKPEFWPKTNQCCFGFLASAQQFSFQSAAMPLAQGQPPGRKTTRFSLGNLSKNFSSNAFSHYFHNRRIPSFFFFSLLTFWRDRIFPQKTCFPCTQKKGQRSCCELQNLKEQLKTRI